VNYDLIVSVIVMKVPAPLAGMCLLASCVPASPRSTPETLPV
jgi:hypothetical protein